VSAAAADEAQIGPTPWHLVDIWWNIGENRPFESYAIDVAISDDVPDGVNLYIAPVGLGHLGKTAFYGGIQTQADGHTKRDRKLRKLGPGLLMSMWGERNLDAIRPAEGGFCQSSGHEGDFISVRRPYAWTKGKYTYRVVRMDEELVDGQPHTWVGAFVYSHERDENVFIGALRFPGKDLVLDHSIASFVEIYGRAIPLEEIPQLSVTFGNLRVNGRPIDKPSASAVYPQGVPDFAAASASAGALVVRIGEKVEDRQKRNVDLLP
jgi:hypothetical protein